MAADNSSSSSTDKKRGSLPFPLLVEKIPFLKIVAPQNPNLPFGAEASERCFTYCSTSLSNRLQGQQPWCRTICFRKMFAIELKGTSLKSGEETVMDIPLPPEGQKAARITRMLARSRNPNTTKDGQRPLTSSGNPEMWKPGWYLYMSKRADASIDELMSMGQSVIGQYINRYFMEEGLRMANMMTINTTRQEKAENAAAKQLQEDTSQHVPEAGTNTQEVALMQSKGKRLMAIELDKVKAQRKLPEMTEMLRQHVNGMHDVDGTILIPLQLPAPPIIESLEDLFTPTAKVLALTRDSITSGKQQELAERLWQKAQTKEPFILASNVLHQAWKALTNDRGDDDGRRRP